MGNTCTIDCGTWNLNNGQIIYRHEEIYGEGKYQSSLIK
ncbi:MAG: hypothetical protein BAJATHORv1_70058 [Candidatus Thorarchaeota archaeon]|nr:MAG: hypothetical protein BAJATHORv1_70058 [Candidatus Thorarchaeota archaeon]